VHLFLIEAPANDFEFNVQQFSPVSFLLWCVTLRACTWC